MFDKLATIQTIQSLSPIEGADLIEVARFNESAWQSVVKKGEFSVGEKVIYIQIDTVLPGDASWSQFLKAKTPVGEPIRLKTVRLRGTLSQGLVLPLRALGVAFSDSLEPGTQVAEQLGVVKYEKQVPSCSEAKGNFPNFIAKTDEPRIQSYPEALPWFMGRCVEIRLKLDGTSATYYKKDGVFGACSRNLDLREDSDSLYWRVANEALLKDYLPEGHFVQGEICGPGVQGNPCGFKEINFYPFNYGKLPTEESPVHFYHISKALEDSIGGPPPLVGHYPSFDLSINDLIELARSQKYPIGNRNAEGIVVRTVDYNLDHPIISRPSFKVISDLYKD